MSCQPVLPKHATCVNVSIQSSSRKAKPRYGAAGIRWPMAHGRHAPRGAVVCRCASRAAETTKSFYDVLGILESGSHDDVKRAYKQLARKYHPDVSPPGREKEYIQCFLRVREAYETLSDPACRAIYDRSSVRGFHLAFSARRQSDEELNRKSEWKNNWQDQLLGLRTRSAMNSDDNLSWGARMRQRNTSSGH